MSLKPQPSLPQEAHRRARILLWARPLVFTIVLGAGIVILGRESPLSAVTPLYVLLGATYFLSLVYIAALRFGVSLTFLLYMQMTLDVLAETALVHYTGSGGSQFSLLYFLSIVVGGVLLRLPGGLYVASLSTLSYGLVMILGLGVLAGAGGPAPLGGEAQVVAGSLVAARLFLHSVFFFLAAFLAGYVAETAQARGRELARTRLDTNDILFYLGSGLVTIDAGGKVVYFNRMAGEILGVPESSARGRGIQELLPERVRVFGDYLSGVLERGASTRREEMLVVDPSGQEIPLGVSAELLWSETGEKRGAIAVFQDLSSVKRMEELLRQADRLAAVGELSAGIAHELRNPLASIRGSAEMLQADEALSFENRRLMALIVKEADRLNRIIEDFLLFARLRPPRFGLVRADRLVEEVLELIRRHHLHTAGIRVSLQSAGTPLLIEADEEQLRQVVLNLCVNSLEALNGQGEVRIRWDSSPPGVRGMIALVVEDNGPGIAAGEMARVFEPFHTTKKNGSGLGLSIVHRIVEAHRGRVEAHSEPGKGARFTVLLPRTQPGEQAFSSGAGDIAEQQNLPAGSERVYGR
jgi:two-component system sensor histidine kinase PilS (NtrC family)